MSDSIDQSQEAGDDSTNVQIARVSIVNHGLNYKDVRDIALDVFRQNIERLSHNAAVLFEKRATEFTDNFLAELQKRNPEGAGKAEDPDFQISLLTSQKEYSRTGDKNLGDLLIDLLVDRSKSEHRDIMQIVLNESLVIAPKLTLEQLASLAIIFILAYTQKTNLTSHQDFQKYLQDHVIPYASLISKKITCYQHLEYSGCGSAGAFMRQLGELLGQTYPGLFTKGFEEAGLKERVPELIGTSLIIPSLCDPSKLQINALNEMTFESNAGKMGLSKEVQDKAKAFWKGHILPADQIRKRVIELVPEMDNIFEVWGESLMNRFSLTSVGVAIAHAYARSKTGFVADLSIWIN